MAETDLQNINKEPETPDDEGFFEKYIGDPYKETAGSIEGLKLLAHMAAGGTLGAGAGYAGSKLLTPGMSRKLPGDKSRTENMLTTLGAIAGTGAGAFTGSRGMDFSSARNLLQSMLERDYWKKHPERFRKNIQKHRQAIDKSEYSHQYDPFQDTERYIQKSSSDEPSLSGFVPDVNVPESQDVINEDPYLHPFGKRKVNDLLGNADKDRDGWSSQFDIGESALELGAGFVPSYVAGRTLGGLMKLPKSTKKRLSVAGGIAGAVQNTGILDEL